MGHPRFRPFRDTFISIALAGAVLFAGAGRMPHRQAHPLAGAAFGGVVQAGAGMAIRKHLLNLENGDAGCVVGVRLPTIVT
jgi:hypothetical protein